MIAGFPLRSFLLPDSPSSVTRCLRWLLVGLAITATCALASCASPAYYWQAMGGQVSLTANREPVDEVIASRETDPELRARLLETREILDFAAAELALPSEGTYQQWVATGRDAMVWNVVATPEFSLDPKTWCHLVAGCVAYRGYFDPEDARRFARKLADDGLDTGIFPAAAYSTLGWFDDPLTDTMLAANGDVRLAALLFHELAHKQLYVKGDTAFSEGYARFVERAGVERWLAANGRQDDYPGWVESQQQSRAAAAAMAQARDDLATLYASGQSEDELRAGKAEVFRELALRLDDLAGGARRWMGDSPNNAHLALAGQYEAGQCAFAMLLHEANGNFVTFHSLAAAKARLPTGERSDWLETPCESSADRVASTDDL